VIVGGEIALSVVLLTAAAALTRQLLSAERRNLGTEKHSLIYLSFLGRSMHVGDATAWADRVSAGLRSVPAVVSTAVMGAPIRPGARIRNANGGAVLVIEGRDTPMHDGIPGAAQLVTPDYFTTFGTPIVAGRTFTAGDRGSSAPVAIIDEASARRFFPGEPAVGRRIRIDGGSSTPEWLTIVGVVANTRGDAFAAGDMPRPELYRPLAQVPAAPVTVLVRVRDDVDTRRMVPLVRAAFQAIDPSSPIAGAITAEEGVDLRMWAARFNARLLIGFAGLAIVLACLGVYATIAYVVGRRRRELAIRIALGATRRDVVANVLRAAAAMIASGIAIGVAGSVAAERVLRTLLYGSAGVDAPILIGVVVAIGAAGGLAAFLPATRAARADPSVALRLD
jgi:predicted permease